MDEVTTSFQTAVDITKTLCENPNCKIEFNESSAKQIGDFINTLYQQLKQSDAARES